MGVETKFECLKCGHYSAFWNQQKEIGYCFYCEKAVFQGPGGSKTPLKESKKAVFNLDLTEDLLSEFRSEILTEDWKIPEKDQKRLILSGKMLFLGDCQVGFRCEGGSLSQWRSLFRSQKGWRMKFSQENRDSTVFFPYNPTKSHSMIIVEGLLDAIRIAQATDWGSKGVLPVALLGTHLNPVALKHLTKVGRLEVYTWMDPDVAGLKSNQSIYKKLPRFLFPSVQEIRTSLEPADMSPEEIKIELRTRNVLRGD